MASSASLHARATAWCSGCQQVEIENFSTGTGGDESWTLPNGQPAEKCGERKTDLLLVWPENESMALDEESVRTHWPGLTRFQPIGNRLFLVAGAALMPTKGQSAQGPTGISGTEEPGCPVALAEQLLE